MNFEQNFTRAGFWRLPSRMIDQLVQIAVTFQHECLHGCRNVVVGWHKLRVLMFEMLGHVPTQRDDYSCN